MINKAEIKKLLNNKEYNEIISIFKKDLSELLFKFAKQNHLEVSEDDEIEELILEISVTFPNLEGHMNTLSSIFCSPDATNAETLNLMFLNYNIIRNALT